MTVALYEAKVKRHTCICKDVCVKRKTEIGVVKLQSKETKDCREPPGARKLQERILLPWNLLRKHVCPCHHLDLWPPQP
jgi:hypothetical protein